LSGDSSGEELPAGARNPRWSPTGDWIAFSLDEDATSQLEFPSRLYVVHPDGRGLAPITANTRGQADYPVWAPNGFLYYGLSGTNTDANGIYRYDVSTGEAVLLIPGEDLQPISISPDGQFLAYSQQNGIHVYVFLTGQDLTQTIEPRDGVPANFVGWLSPPVAQK
jgi:Tol biopolymer transport system component